MPDHHYRDNELATCDLLKKGYEFTRTFTLENLDGKRIVLRCQGLDTLGRVIVNGQKVGENEITVQFDSPINAALERYDASPGWCTPDGIPGYHHVRKPDGSIVRGKAENLRVCSVFEMAK